ncbi:MAG TPA: AAA domain-containing protein, partial [Acetobacteraceae bacterium]|nr:AAA domain-containing protein [Acetobacteraceae bacterium]
RPQTPDTLSEGFPKGSALWRGPGAEPLAFATALAHLPAAPDIPAAWHRGLASDAMRRAGAEWLRAEAASRAALARLGEHGLALPPPALRPAAEALEAGHATLAVAAPPGLALTGLPGWSATLRAEAASLATLARLAHRAAELLGLAAPLTLPALGIALRAINLVAEGGETVIAGITPTLAEREHRVIIAAAAAEIAALQQAAETLAARFALPPAAQAEELRRHAAALRDAGLLGFLSAAPKAAARRHAELRKQPGKPGRDEMAADLAALAGHLEAVAALEARAEYRAVFGFRFRGLATDAATALAIADWAARVRGDLSGLDEATQTARRVLLAADPERLQAIAAFAAEPGYAALQRCLGATSEAVTLDDLAARLDAMAHAAAGLAEGCDRLGIPGATALAALPALCRLLRDAAASFEAAALPPPLAAALGEHPPAPLADHAGFAAALALAAAIAALPVPEPARQVLHAMDPAEIRDEVVVAARRVEAALDRALALWRALADRLGLDEAAFLGGAPHHAAPAAVAERLRHAATHGAALGGWIAFLIERRNAEALGLGGLLALWDEQAVSGPLADAFDRVLHRGLARLAFARHPEIDRFTGLGQEEARRRFKALDAEVTELRRRMLAASLATRPVPDGNHVGRRGEWTDRALILAETGKQKKHLPIRQLLDRAGAAVQTLKPCFMMSPLSVAQYLKPTGLRFDLLVIDEASQMRPEDALGAIARAEQIVVVGDTKQLPPTSFFARLDDDSEDTDAEPIEAESILDLAQTVFRPMRRLRWHYRSRHGSLVAFSNREFYDDDLIVFPSPAEADPRQGVGSTKIDGIYKSNVNPAEVAAICAAAVEHMRAEPHRSLGIATMNQAQRELIAEEMDRLATLHPDVEAYRERWANTLERFFVKNLENVQGDERDVIFISTVFGPPAPGQRVRQNFGPINGPSGHRRLNVLFTRAKHRVHLFTSMTPDDIVAGPESPRGAQVLKRYLAYAASGGWLDAGTETGRAPDSDFEVFVADRLRAAGYDVVPQVGVSGFFIDLAVRDPDMPGAFLLGVECDGATYHSSRSAR